MRRLRLIQRQHVPCVASTASFCSVPCSPHCALPLHVLECVLQAQAKKARVSSSAHDGQFSSRMLVHSVDVGQHGCVW